MQKSLSTVVFLLMTSIAGLASPFTSIVAKEPTTIMCLPGELLFSETFDLDTVSDRWAFQGDFVLRDGSLRRTNLYPTENRRVRIQDASFYNTIIQFDYKFSDRTTDIRLVTGSGGHYNSVTQLRQNYFQVNNLPQHPLIKHGYFSIGCSHCTFKTNDKRNIRSGRWKNKIKTECGIHLSRTN